MKLYRFCLTVILSLALMPGLSFANDDWDNSGSDSEMSDRYPSSDADLDNAMNEAMDKEPIEKPKPRIVKAKKKAKKKIAKYKKKKKKHKKKKKAKKASKKGV